MVKKQQPLPQPSLLQRLWRNAWSDVWGYATILGSGLWTSLSYVSNLVDNQGVRDALNQIKLPAEFALVIALIGAVTVISAEHGTRDS